MKPVSPILLFLLFFTAPLSVAWAQPGKWSDDPPIPFQDSCHWELSMNVSSTFTQPEAIAELNPKLNGPMAGARLLYKIYRQAHFYGQFGLATLTSEKRTVAWTHWTTGIQLDMSYNLIHPYTFVGIGLMSLQNPFPVKKDNKIILIDPWKSSLLHFGFGVNILSSRGIGVKGEASILLMDYPGSPLFGNGEPERLYQYNLTMGVVKRF